MINQIESDESPNCGAPESYLSCPMRVTLMSSFGTLKMVWLPSHSEGRFHFSTETMQNFELPLYMEQVNGRWVAFSGKGGAFLRYSKTQREYISIDQINLSDQMFIHLVYKGENAVYTLYVEFDRPGDSIHYLYAFEDCQKYSIGRSPDCDIFYDNSAVSRDHAILERCGDGWMLEDRSLNGTYVNGRRVGIETGERKMELSTGDAVFVMGLQILLGPGFAAINSGNQRVQFHSSNIHGIHHTHELCFPPVLKEQSACIYDRKPRKHVSLNFDPISIESPPMSLSANKIPLLLRLGNPIVMGGRALFTGNFIMAITSLLIPALTQGLTEKDRHEYEAKRTAGYREYLNQKQQEILMEQRREEHILNAQFLPLHEALEQAAQRKRLWEQQPRDEDFLRVRLGYGQVPLRAKLEYHPKRFELERDPLETEMYQLAEQSYLLNDAPVTINLRESFVLGVLGENRDTLQFFRNLVLQIAITHSYDEVKLVFLMEPFFADQISFVKYLPHCWSDQRDFRFFATEKPDAQQISEFLRQDMEERISNEPRKSGFPCYYVILAQSKELFESMEILKVLVAQDKYCGVSIVAAFDGLPKETSCLIQLSANENTVIDLKNPEVVDQGFRFDADSSNSAENAGLQSLIETKIKLHNSNGYSLPQMLTFLEMYNVGRVEHLNPMARWAENNPIKSLAAPVGTGTDGKVFTLDLHEKRQGPHGLVAGMTGSGKSEFIITYILSMAVNYSPDEVAFILIDYKGGGLADAFVNPDRKIHLPHVVGTITNLDGASIQRSLMSINSELKRRQEVFKQAKTLVNEGTMDIYDYQKLFRAGKVSEPMPHLFIISDEFAELKAQQPEFMDELISAARIGRSLGVHLILATQKPGGVVNNQIWSNTKFRVCLRVQDRSDSMEMLKRPEAAELKNIGRFYLQVGYNEFFALGQSAWCGADYIPQDEVAVQKDETIQFLDNAGQPILSVRPSQNHQNKAESRQIVAIVSYLSALAQREGIQIRSLWKEPIPGKLDFDVLAANAMKPMEARLPVLLGMVDDPEHQTQYPFWLDLSRIHNLLLCGFAGSGKSTLLRTLLLYVVEHYSPETVQYYILDLSAGALNQFRGMPHCGAYLTEANDGDVGRLFDFLRELIERRKKLFYAEDVTNYDAYVQVKPLPLVLFLIDGYTNIKSLTRGPELFNNMQEYLRDGVNYGVCFFLSCNHIVEVSSRARQEMDYRLVLQAKDRFEYSEILGIKCNTVPASLIGRGMCVIDGRPLEFQTACPYVQEGDQTRAQRMKQRMEIASAGYPEQQRAERLPMIQTNQEYLDFCLGFQRERLPLGYSTSNMSAIAIPFQQLYSISLYFGNPIGVRPVLSNLVVAAGFNGADLVLVKRQADTVVDSAFLQTANSAGVETVTVLESNAKGISALNELIYHEILARNVFRDEYSIQNGLPESDKGRAKKAASYIRARTKPLMVLIESFGDVCRADLDDEIKAELEAYLSRIRGYNIYFAACFYPNEEGNISSSNLMRSFNKEELLMLFGGQYDRQCVTSLPMDFRRIEKINPKYNRFLFKYRGEYYTILMPCGELNTGLEDPDEAPIIQ